MVAHEYPHLPAWHLDPDIDVPQPLPASRSLPHLLFTGGINEDCYNFHSVMQVTDVP